MTADELLREAYEEGHRLYMGRYLELDFAKFKQELAARGLAVVEVSKGEPLLSLDAEGHDRCSVMEPGKPIPGAAHPCSLVDGSTEIELNGPDSTNTLVQRNLGSYAGLKESWIQQGLRWRVIKTPCAMRSMSLPTISCLSYPSWACSLPA